MEGGGRRRLTLLEQMSSKDRLTGLSLEEILGTNKRHLVPLPVRAPAVAAPPASATANNLSNRTLLDVIRDEEPGTLFGKDKKSWKAFRDKLRLKRAGAAWTSSVPIPTSDIPIRNNSPNSARSLMSRRNSVRFTPANDSNENSPNFRPQMSRRSSVHYPVPEDGSSANAHAVGEGPPTRSFRPQMSRRTSARLHQETEEDDDDGPQEMEDRPMSAREAAAAQEAAEAEAAVKVTTAGENADDEEEYSDRGGGAMSLMDLMGSKYDMGGDEDEVDEEEEEEEEDGGGRGGGGMEHACCVCMVRHKGSAFIPCGHTFCRMCSRELFVQRGNCPICNGFILEILDIF